MHNPDSQTELTIWKPTRAKNIVLFVVAILFAMAVSTYAITSLRIKETLQDVQNNFDEKTASHIADNATYYLSARLLALSDQADQPFIVNSVLHPPADKAAITDLLATMRLFREDVGVALLNIDGEVVAAHDFSQPPTHQAWVAEMVNGERQSYVELVASAVGISARFAVPISFHGNPEGIMVAERNFNTQAFLKTIGANAAQSTLRVFTPDGDVLTVFGQARQLDQSARELNIVPLANRIVMYQTPYNLNGVLNELLLFTLVVTSLLAALFLAVFQRLGRRMFIEPQQHLQRIQGEVVRVNKRLATANEELSQFAYRSSHDLRGPLTTITGLARIAAEDLSDGDTAEVRYNLQKIEEQSTKLEELVGDILELSRADLSDQKNTPLDLDDIYSNIHQRLEEQARQANVRVELKHRARNAVTTQTVRVTQILENLISNGIKYANPKTSERFVRVSTLDTEEGIEITVADNGVGVPRDKYEEVFQMFTRYHPQHATGSGLGMAIVKKHVDRLQGKIWLTSSKAGTTVHVALPGH